MNNQRIKTGNSNISVFIQSKCANVLVNLSFALQFLSVSTDTQGSSWECMQTSKHF